MNREMLVIIAAVLTLALMPAPAGAEERAKAVLVTGASSGIGLRIAEVLAENGFHVYAGARKAADLERLDAKQNVSAVRLDVTVQEDIDAAVEYVRSQGRGLWGVVNNAGVVAISSLASGPESELDFTFDVNVYGPFRVNRAFVPLLIESGGRTTTIGSISGFIAGQAGAYSMSKFAVEAYTDSLAAELADSGVHVSIVEPGGYKSRIRDTMADRALEVAATGAMTLSAEEREALAGIRASNETLKEPDEVAEAVLDLMRSAAPKRRYMVTPNEDQARATLQAGFRRMLELNHDQPYSLDRDGLIALLDELLAEF